MQFNRAAFQLLKKRSFYTKSLLFDKEPLKFREISPALKKIKLKQLEYKKEDGLPTFLKKGTADKILFNFSWILVVTGIFLSFVIMYKSDLALRN